MMDDNNLTPHAVFVVGAEQAKTYVHTSHMWHTGELEYKREENVQDE